MDRTLLIQRFSTAFGVCLVLAVMAIWLKPIFFKGPAPISLVNTPASGALSPLEIPPIFGREGVETEADAPALPSNIQLAGVIAGGRRPIALLTVDGKTEAFPIGETVSPGVVLDGVTATQVTLKVNGRSMSLELPDKSNTPVAGAPPTVRPATQIVQKAPAPIANLNVQSVGPNHYALSRAELNRILQDPAQARNLGKAEVSPSGGVLLSEVPPGSVPDRLGIRTADILKSVNGRAITGLNDLPKLYSEFGSAATVNLDIYRNGQGALLQYTLRP